MTTKGTPSFDALSLGTLTADFTGATVSLSARAAFVHTGKGTTHGWTDGSGSIWSEETMKKLASLAESMEKDLAKVHFSESASAPATSERGIQSVGGIGEHLNKEGDAPQM